jgi:hemerythrin-like metal-binding protein
MALPATGASAKVLTRDADILAMFEWNDQYRTGIPSIDGQHKGLFSIGAELHTAMSKGQAREKMRVILDRLVQYTVAHFSHEERLMQLYHYPAYAVHKGQHDELTRQVTRFCADVQSGKIAVGIPLLQFIEDWLKQHIGQSDQGYAKLLAANAVK